MPETKNQFAFEVIDRKTRKEVDIADILKERWAKCLCYTDIDGFYLSPDGHLILADECGKFVFVPSEDRYLITVHVGQKTYKIKY